MTTLSRVLAESRFSVILLFFSVFFLNLYIRKRRKTFLMMTLGSLIYVLLSLTIFYRQKGMNLISLSALGIAVISTSYKELDLLDKKGKTVADLFGFDWLDLTFACLLLVGWLLLKYFA